MSVGLFLGKIKDRILSHFGYSQRVLLNAKKFEIVESMLIGLSRRHPRLYAFLIKPLKDKSLEELERIEVNERKRK